MDINGLALSTSLVALCNVVILFAILRKNVGSLGARRIIVSYLKIIAASAVMGAVIYFLWGWLEGFAYRGLWELILLMLAVIITGAGVYIACTFLFRMDEVRFVLGLFKKFKKKG